MLCFSSSLVSISMALRFVHCDLLITVLTTMLRCMMNTGAIEVYTKDGFRKTLRKSGEFFGEGALLNPGKIRSASIRCLTPVQAIEIRWVHATTKLSSHSFYSSSIL